MHTDTAAETAELAFAEAQDPREDMTAYTAWAAAQPAGAPTGYMAWTRTL